LRNSNDSISFAEDGLVYICGESESGKLGIDVSFSAQVAPRQMQLPAPAVHVVCGGHHTLVLTGEDLDVPLMCLPLTPHAIAPCIVRER